MDDFLNDDSHDGLCWHELHLIPVFSDEHGHDGRVEHLVWNEVDNVQIRIMLSEQSFHHVDMTTCVGKECNLLSSCNLGVNELADVSKEQGRQYVVEV